MSSRAFGHAHGAVVRHDAFLYEGDAEFLAGTLEFIAAARAAGEPVIAALDRPKIALLQGELGRDADAVQFFDIRELGGNPARLIPAWREAIDACAPDGRHVWGIGEPIWPGRSPAEIAECHRHEALANVAFDDGPVVAALSLRHRITRPRGDRGGALYASGSWSREARGTRVREFSGLDTPVGSFSDPLPEPRALARTVMFGTGELAEIRRLVERRAHAAGLTSGAP